MYGILLPKPVLRVLLTYEISALRAVARGAHFIAILCLLTPIFMMLAIGVCIDISVYWVNVGWVHSGVLPTVVSSIKDSVIVLIGIYAWFHSKETRDAMFYAQRGDIVGPAILSLRLQKTLDTL